MRPDNGARGKWGPEGMSKDPYEMRFSECVRTELENRLAESLQREHPDLLLAEFKGWIAGFISILEKIASTPTEAIPLEKDRKARLRAFVNATESFIDALEKLDDVSFGYAVFAGFNEIDEESDRSVGPVGKAVGQLFEAAMTNSRHGIIRMYSRVKKGRAGAVGWPSDRAWRDMQGIAHVVQTEHIGSLRTFALGMRKSLKSPPLLDKDDCKFNFRVAQAIEHGMSRMGLQVSTSETGLAGSIFAATMELAGHKASSTSYWLEKAKSHPAAYSRTSGEG